MKPKIVLKKQQSYDTEIKKNRGGRYHDYKNDVGVSIHVVTSKNRNGKEVRTFCASGRAQKKTFNVGCGYKTITAAKKAFLREAKKYI